MILKQKIVLSTFLFTIKPITCVFIFICIGSSYSLYCTFPKLLLIQLFHYNYSFLSNFVSFSVTKATLQLKMSVCLSIHLSVIKTPQPLRIKPICSYAYLLISQIPISHHANQLSCQSATMPPPQLLCQLAIIPIPISHHHACWPIYQSAICPAFATSKTFWLVF